MQNGDTYLYGIGTYDGTNYSSATTIQDVINGKQEALVSGTNLKTINNESLLGSGNITISGGGVVPDLGNAKIFYGTCDTAASTTKKEVVCSAFTSADFVAGALIFVKFSKTNSGAVASLTMDVNSTGEVRLKKMYKNTAPSDLAAVAELQADVTYLFTYTGSAWVCMTLDYNTTYSGMTDAEVTAGTGTTNRLITPARLKSAINT
jgi:flagellin-like hook-associated protein FlgL